MGIKSYFFEKSKWGSFVSKSPRGHSTNCIIFLIVEYHSGNERPHLIPCCGDSRILISSIHLDWVYINIFTDPAETELWCSLGPKGQRDLRNSPCPIPPGDTKQGVGDRFALVCPYESISLAPLPLRWRRSSPFLSLPPFHPLNPSHLFDDCKNITYI